MNCFASFNWSNKDVFCCFLPLIIVSARPHTIFAVQKIWEKECWASFGKKGGMLPSINDARKTGCGSSLTSGQWHWVTPAVWHEFLLKCSYLFGDFLDHFLISWCSRVQSASFNMVCRWVLVTLSWKNRLLKYFSIIPLHMLLHLAWSQLPTGND